MTLLRLSSGDPGPLNPRRSDVAAITLAGKARHCPVPRPRLASSLNDVQAASDAADAVRARACRRTRRRVLKCVRRKPASLRALTVLQRRLPARHVRPRTTAAAWACIDDVCRAKTRIQATPAKAGRRQQSVAAILLKILREEGPAGYYRGFFASMLNTFSTRSYARAHILPRPSRRAQCPDADLILQNTRTSSSTRSCARRTSNVSPPAPNRFR